MEQKTFLTPPIKAILFFTIILLTGILLIAVGNPFKKLSAPTLTPAPRINAIEISADAKSILNAETKAVIFTIDDAQKYLKDSGYLYNSDTFQTTNAKYAGDCFLDAVLSNKRLYYLAPQRDQIVFSAGCMQGDLPQPWIGLYSIPELLRGYSYDQCVLMSCKGSYENYNCKEQNCKLPAEFKFVIAGSGRNFVWSADDKTITYETDLGSSGLTETRLIYLKTGEIYLKTGEIFKKITN